MSDSILTNQFLAEKRLAFVGVSRNSADFSRGLFRELARRGYDVVPVNPGVEQVDGRRCHARLQDIVPPVTAAFVMTPPSMSAQVVRDGIEAGVQTIWLHRGVGQGSVTEEAVRTARAAGLAVVEGCPYMFLPNADAVHRVHGFFHRLFGRKVA
jgi:uncharacterized protein